jgi:nitroreductase
MFPLLDAGALRRGCMDVSAAVRGRRSVRSYKEQEVEIDKIEKVLEAGRLSPSANNRQEWKFIVVKNVETKKKLARAALNQSFIGQAPVVLVACATESKAIMTCGHPTYAVDVSIAFAYMLLQAYELGLGTCWIGAFKEDEVKSVLGVPKEVRVVAMSPLGYSATDTVSRSRKSLAEITCFEAYR